MLAQRAELDADGGVRCAPALAGLSAPGWELDAEAGSGGALSTSASQLVEAVLE